MSTATKGTFLNRVDPGRELVRHEWYALLGILVVWAALFGLRLVGPEDLMDKDQENPAAYVQDAVLNGRWMVQWGYDDRISSKPPLYTWLAALTTMALGRISPFSLYVAPALATLATILLVWRFGCRHWGRRGGLISALVYLVSAVVAKQMALARTDGVFTFLVTLAALCAYQTWTTGRGALGFWLAAALATLTKGPLGLAFGAGGWLAAFWKAPAPDSIPPPPRSDSRRRMPRPWIHALGLVLYLAIAGGWFWAAYLDTGDALTEKMIHAELLSHATGENTGEIPGSRFYKPPLLFLARFAPWSLVTLVGLWRVVKRPSADPTTRRFERFLFCWFTAGITLLALGVHHRGDLLFPLIPAAALLAGRELAGWMDHLTPNWARAWLWGGTSLGLSLIAAKYWWLRPADPFLRQTGEVKALAARLVEQVGPGFPFTHVDAPYGLQIYLNTLHRAVSAERAARLLREASAAFVVVSDAVNLTPQTNDAARIHTLIEWRMTGRPAVRVLGNRPELRAAPDMAVCLGPLHVRMVGVRPVQLADRRLVFAPPEGEGWVEITNQSEEPRDVEVRWTPDPSWRRHRLNPGEMWRLHGPLRPPAPGRLAGDP